MLDIWIWRDIRKGALYVSLQLAVEYVSLNEYCVHLQLVRAQIGLSQPSQPNIATDRLDLSDVFVAFEGDVRFVHGR